MVAFVGDTWLERLTVQSLGLPKVKVFSHKFAINVESGNIAPFWGMRVRLRQLSMPGLRIINADRAPTEVSKSVGNPLLAKAVCGKSQKERQHSTIIFDLQSRLSSGIIKKETSPMQTLFEAASHIAQEIERTRQHLTNLEQALEGLKPLITVDAATTTLTYSIASHAQPVEDLSVVNAEEPAKKKAKAKSKSPVKGKAEMPKVGNPKTEKPKAKKEKVVVPAPLPVTEPAKLPATGAEFWLKCLGRKKATVAQLADAALKKLKLEDSAKNVMTTRVKAWAYQAVKKGTLLEAGMRDGAKLFQLTPIKEESDTQSAQAAEPVVAAVGAEVAPVAEAGSTT